MERVDRPMDKTAGELMSANPRIISDDAVGGAAVKLMEDNRITSLAIVTRDNKPAGGIHLHDLLRAGVV